MGVLDFLLGGSESKQSTVDPAQAPFLQFLREQAQAQFEGSRGQGPAGQNAAAFLGQQGQSFLDQLAAPQNFDSAGIGAILNQSQGLAQQFAQPNSREGSLQSGAGFGDILSGNQLQGFINGQQLQPFTQQQDFAGQPQLSQFAGGQRPEQQRFGGQFGGGQAGQEVFNQVDSLGDILNRNLELGLNSIQSRFGQSGTIGSRAGVEAGSALGDTQLAFGQGASSLFAQDRAQRQQAAQFGLGLQGQAAGQAAQLGFGQQQQQQLAATNQLGSQLGAAQTDIGATLAALQARSNQQLSATQGQRSNQLQAGLGGIGGQLQGLEQLFQGRQFNQGLQQQSAQAGLGALGGLFNLGQAGFGAQQAPLVNLANLFGQPTVLGGAGSTQGGLIPGIAGAFNITNR